MDIKLDVLEKRDLELVRSWRNKVRETLRTPYMLTEEMQDDYYKNIICNRDSTTRYYGFKRRVDSESLKKIGVIDYEFCGYGGIENIIWENRSGEISILIGEDFRGEGIGKKCVDLILDQAFNYLNLDVVYGECYKCGNHGFWDKYVNNCLLYDTDKTILKNRKYYNGQYYDSLYFSFSRKGL